MSIILASGRNTVSLARDALVVVAQAIDGRFEQAVEVLLNCSGKVIVTGMGKSGHIANKIAATLASTGTPAFFLHPADACHGDLGSVAANDVVLALSHSGNSSEIADIMPTLHAIGVAIIGISSNPASMLAKQATLHICLAITKEACPHNLAPTSSTTAALVMGDALAMALFKKRGLAPSDFAFRHPKGTLGRRLTLRIHNIMRSDYPIVLQGTSISDTLVVMTQKAFGFIGIVNVTGKVVGIFSDGDLRRLFVAVDGAQLADSIDAVMTTEFVAFTSQQLVVEAVEVFEQQQITGAFCLDDNGQPLGAFNFHDLLDSGVQ